MNSGVLKYKLFKNSLKYFNGLFKGLLIQMKTYVLNIFIDFWRKKINMKLSLQKTFLLMVLSDPIWLSILTSI